MNAILGIVGWSGSGKTTLLEQLVQQLSKKSLVINVIKHSHHDVTLEPSHKDSARVRNAGAVEVMLCSPFRYALVHELREQEEPSLAQLLSFMKKADLTVVEGYKWAEIRKLEIYRPSLGKEALYLKDPYIIAVASDQERPIDCPEHLAWMNLNCISDIQHWLELGLAQNSFDLQPK
jgi:molybdopterin-guanine dinucleotide biosynthesis protein B